MLIKLIRKILGYVQFSFTGGFAEGFINDCYFNKIKIRSIVKTEDGLIACIYVKDYFKLHKIAFKNGGKVKVLKRVGLPFLLLPLKNRWGIFGGILAAMFLVSFLGSFIWNVTVVGNNTLAESKIVDYFAENGLKMGARWSSIDKENLEFGALAQFDEVSWVSVNKFGSLALIEVNETRNKPQIVNDSKITNVIACEDGIITHVTALGGWNAVSQGDAVVKGDLLISGINENETNKVNHFAHAHGTVLAKVSGEIKINISREQTEKQYTLDKSYKTLYFFGIEIPLYIKTEKGDYEEENTKSYFILNEFRLPIGVFESKRRYYTLKSNALGDEDLKSLAQVQLEKEEANKLANCEIITKEPVFEISDDGCFVVEKYVCIKDIGIEKEIFFQTEE